MIDRLTEQDRPRWTKLWTAYLAFYETSLPAEQFEHTWHRILAAQDLHAFALRHEGQLVGMTHYLMHESSWTMRKVVYLQDLYVDPAVRGTGGGRRLIEAVAEAARSAQAPRMYWLTQSHNVVARQLYDRLAKHSGFIRYEYPV